jgi:hypothetical protein
MAEAVKTAISEPLPGPRRRRGAQANCSQRVKAGSAGTGLARWL